MLQAVSKLRLGRTVPALCALVLLAACSASGVEPGPLRNNAKEPINPLIETPLPHDAPGNGL